MTLHGRRSQQSGVGPDGWCILGHIRAQGCPLTVLPRYVPTRRLSWSARGRSTALTWPLLSGVQALPEAGGREGCQRPALCVVAVPDASLFLGTPGLRCGGQVCRRLTHQTLRLRLYSWGAMAHLTTVGSGVVVVTLDPESQTATWPLFLKEDERARPLASAA